MGLAGAHYAGGRIGDHGGVGEDIFFQSKGALIEAVPVIGQTLIGARRTWRGNPHRIKSNRRLYRSTPWQGGCIVRSGPPQVQEGVWNGFWNG